MNADQWNRIQTLFKELVDLKPATRIERLESIRTEDPLLYEELESMIAADKDDNSILDGFALDSFPTILSLEEREIGPFRIVKKIGSGGMGDVYLAERFKGGFDQTVALKLIRFGLGGKQATHRFEEERRILARLQHPHIARLLDGGFTEDGHLWFAMEYLEGENIIAYCEKRSLPIKQRLKLFLDITEAVQHAHKNLIVHSDLKPGNILVTSGEKARIKLLDFGIAQILDETTVEGEVYHAMTRAYASPEQLSGSSITTATDIYSLGIILYQLIAGCHPKEEFRRKNSMPSPANKELLAICEKAMHADAAQRFESVLEMGDEVRMWLKGKPVITYSAKPAYRMGKWISRNRAVFGLGIASVVTMALLVLIYTNQLKQERDRAQKEAVRATNITEVLSASLSSIDPMQNQGRELTARSMVDMSTFYINNHLKNDQGTRADLLMIMADIYSNLIIPEVADSISKQAEELKYAAQDTTAFSYINLLAQRSIILDKAGKYDQGLAMIHRAIKLSNEFLDPGSLEFGSIHLDYTYHLDVNKNFETADSILTLIRPIYENNREVAGEAYDDFIFYLGTNYRRLGKFKLAEKYLFESLELSRNRYPDTHETIASTLNHISSLYQNMGEPEKAIPYAIEAHEMRLKIFGPAHLNTIAAHSNTARSYSAAGRLQEAGDTYEEVISIFREEYGEDNFYLAGILQSYGNVYVRMNDYVRAEIILRESVDLSAKLLPADHILQAYPKISLADVLRLQGRFSEALPLAESAYELRSATLPSDNPELIASYYTLGLCLWNLGRKEEAEPHLNAAMAFYSADTDRYEKRIAEIEGLGL